MPTRIASQSDRLFLTTHLMCIPPCNDALRPSHPIVLTSTSRPSSSRHRSHTTPRPQGTLGRPPLAARWSMGPRPCTRQTVFFCSFCSRTRRPSKNKGRRHSAPPRVLGARLPTDCPFISAPHPLHEYTLTTADPARATVPLSFDAFSLSDPCLRSSRAPTHCTPLASWAPDCASPVPVPVPRGKVRSPVESPSEVPASRGVQR